MVTTTFKGGMGNQMFQYAIGRIIAEATSRCLNTPSGLSFLNPRLRGGHHSLATLIRYGHL